jgi:putative ABC transport system permease protein
MIRQAIRSLIRNPGFTAAAVLTLSLGLGASTSMFSLVNGILLKPLPYEEPERLVTISIELPELRHIYPTVPLSAYYVSQWQNHSSAFEKFALLISYPANLTGSAEPERLAIVTATPSLFPMLGVSAALGRTFIESEGERGNHRVVILSDGFWRRRFGADPNVVGSAIQLNGADYEIVGVMPAGFRFPKNDELHRMIRMPERTDLWVPLTFAPEETQRVVKFNYAAIARMNPGVSLQDGETELNQILSDLPKPPVVRVEQLQADMVARVQTGLIVLMAAVCAVLLVVCVNISNLLFARGISRRREFALRTALGASRRRLCATMLSESAVLCALGSAAGIPVAYWLLDIVRLHLPTGLPRMNEVSLDLSSAAFATGAAVLSAILCGLIPAWRLSSANPADALRDGGHGATAGRMVVRWRGAFVAAEVGLSVVLLVAAGLLLKSFSHITAIDQGFSTTSVFTSEVVATGGRYTDRDRRTALFTELAAQSGTLPGVEEAGAVSHLPLTGEMNIMAISPEGTPMQPAPQAEYRNASSGYFAAMRIPILRGQIYPDVYTGSVPALISKLTAERVWPGQNPIGRHFKAPMPGAQDLVVSGVVGDVRSKAPQDDHPLLVYLPLSLNPPEGMNIVVRTSGTVPPIRLLVKGLDPEIPASPPIPLASIASESTAARRFQVTLLAAFAVVGLLLACLGIFGVVSFSVVQRQRDIGILLALGARTANIARVVLHQGMKPVVIGLALGLPASWAVSRTLSSLLFQVTPFDLQTYSVVTAILLLTALAACYIPTRRATRIDPISILHYE